MTNMKRSLFQDHAFHLVSPSPWPLYTSISLLNLTSSAALSMHIFSNSYQFFYLGLILVVASMSFWFRDIIAEGTFLGDHTLSVQRGLNWGILLFIVSEALFFMAIFWAFFHSALTPTVELGGHWPPMGIEPVNALELPLLNTVILLSSGASVTYAHHCLIQGKREGSLYGSIATILLAAVFTAFQGIEYSVSSFTISDGVFGTCFFFGTGFHGLHVIIGTIFLGVALWRIYAYHLTDNHHVGFEGGILYWHFVDVVWLFCAPLGIFCGCVLSDFNSIKALARSEGKQGKDTRVAMIPYNSYDSPDSEIDRGPKHVINTRNAVSYCRASR